MPLLVTGSVPTQRVRIWQPGDETQHSAIFCTKIALKVTKHYLNIWFDDTDLYSNDPQQSMSFIKSAVKSSAGGHESEGQAPFMPTFESCCTVKSTSWVYHWPTLDHRALISLMSILSLFVDFEPVKLHILAYVLCEGLWALDKGK